MKIVFLLLMVAQVSAFAATSTDDSGEPTEAAVNKVGFGPDPQVFTGSVGLIDRPAYMPADPGRVADGVMTETHPGTGKGKNDAVSMNDAD